jgi:hypothetical protein
LVSVEANIGIHDDGEIALDHGADGVGLLRIEQLYFARPMPLTEDELFRELESLIAPLAFQRADIEGRWALASMRVRRDAEISRQPPVFWPAHNGEKSPMPRLSALARKGAMADAARGNLGAAALIGPSSLTMRLTIPRAGRPVNRFVTAVRRAASLVRAARCTILVVASGHSM